MGYLHAVNFLTVFFSTFLNYVDSSTLVEKPPKIGKFEQNFDVKQQIAEQYNIKKFKIFKILFKKINNWKGFCKR